MFAGCIEKMSAQSCDSCARRDTCAFVLPEALGFVLSAINRNPEPAARPASASSPFLEFIGHVARGVARNRRPSEPRETPFRDMIERELEPLLGVGRIEAEAVARALGYGRQTLYRRLKAEGTSFERVLDELRHRVALRLIRDEGRPVKEVAWRLGYADPAAFSRAFKRWTGVCPRDLKGRRPH